MSTPVVLAAAGEVSDFTEQVGVPLIVAMIAFAATVGAAALSFAFGRWAETTRSRREGYAEATRELVAWGEYPFRIRRRTSNDPQALATLADIGHTHQEALRYRETWILSEDRWVGRVFNEVRADLAAVLGPACNHAWGTDPIEQPAGMTLAGWGPQDIDEQIKRFERAVAFRFGWRRLVAIVGWHPGA